VQAIPPIPTHFSVAWSVKFCEITLVFVIDLLLSGILYYECYIPHGLHFATFFLCESLAFDVKTFAEMSDIT